MTNTSCLTNESIANIQLLYQSFSLDFLYKFIPTFCYLYCHGDVYCDHQYFNLRVK